MTQYTGPDRRQEVDRREEWRDRCASCDSIQKYTDQHRAAVGATMKEIKDELIELRTSVVPRWVFTWIGGATAAAILALSIWTAQKGIVTAERVVRIEAVTEAMAKNISKLVQDSGRVPVEPIVKDKK